MEGNGSVEKGSVLDAIREKELSINAKVLEARKKAEDIVAESRRKAVAIKEKAAEEAPAEAKAYYDAKLNEACKEAEQVQSSIDVEVKSVETQAKNKLAEAVQVVKRLVIP